MMDRNLKIAVGIGLAAIIIMLYLIYFGFGENKGAPASYVSTRETETQRINKALQSLTAPEEQLAPVQVLKKSTASKYSPVSKDIIESLTAPQSN